MQLYISVEGAPSAEMHFEGKQVLSFGISKKIDVLCVTHCQYFPFLCLQAAGGVWRAEEQLAESLLIKPACL